MFLQNVDIHLQNSIPHHLFNNVHPALNKKRGQAEYDVKTRAHYLQWILDTWKVILTNHTGRKIGQDIFHYNQLNWFPWIVDSQQLSHENLVLFVELEGNTAEHLKRDQYLIIIFSYAYHVVSVILNYIYQQLSACLYHFYWYNGYDANFTVIFSVIYSNTSLVVHVSDSVKVSIFLRCGTTSLGKIWDIFTPEDEIITMSQNIRHELSSDAASNPRRTETSTTMVQKSRTSHSYCNFCYHSPFWASTYSCSNTKLKPLLKHVT